MNRKDAPPIKQITKLFLPKAEKIDLSNGLPVHIVNMGTQDVVKLQLVFNAGRPYELKRLVAKTTARLLKEGTSQYSSAEIAEQIDFYGATLATPTNLDNSNIVFYSLSKHFKTLLPLVTDLLLRPTFPQKELNTYLENSKRRLKVDLTKNDVVAYRKVTEFIFGETHPYGYNSDEAAFNQIERADLIQHFKQHYNVQNCQVFLSGRVTESMLADLENQLGQLPIGKKSILPAFPLNNAVPQKYHFAIPNSMQTAIRIGKKTIGRKHPDFANFMVLNTILGGYFGSRLMMNIREDKGFTYNIYSAQDTMLHDACFYVATEVGNEYVTAAKKEIFKEIEILQNDLVAAEELQMVRNYILGNMLNMVDGPFHVADVTKTLVLNNMSYDSFINLVETINTVSATTIRDLAQKYLDLSDMWEVTAG